MSVKGESYDLITTGAFEKLVETGCLRGIMVTMSNNSF